MKGEVIIREVKPNGNGGYIYCPKRWVGCIIRCEVKKNPRAAQGKREERK